MHITASVDDMKLDMSIVHAMIVYLHRVTSDLWFMLAYSKC